VTSPPPAPRLDEAPAPLKVAASLALIEGAALLVYAVLEIVNLSSTRVAVSVTTSVFFALYGAVLVLCAWGLVRGRSLARSPVVLAQLIQLGVAWSFRDGATLLVAIALAVVALVTVAGVLHPQSLAYLDAENEHEV
jgi:hypothetical protein